MKITDGTANTHRVKMFDIMSKVSLSLHTSLPHVLTHSYQHQRCKSPSDFVDIGQMFTLEMKTFDSVVHFQGKQLSHNAAAGIIISNQSLVLQGVSRTTGGNYTCVGYNTEGDGESGPFFLNVMCELEI